MATTTLNFLREPRANLENMKISSHTWLEKSVLFRVGELGLAIADVAVSSSHTIIGMGGAVMTVYTLGRSHSLYRGAMHFLNDSRFITSATYIDLLVALNPNAEFLSKKRVFSIYNLGDGFISNKFNAKSKQHLIELSSSSSFWDKHVMSRIGYVEHLLLIVIARVADGALGILGLSLSLLTLGRVASINNLAYRGLQAPALLQDIFFCVANCLNPQLEVERLRNN